MVSSTDFLQSGAALLTQLGIDLEEIKQAQLPSWQRFIQAVQAQKHNC